MRARWMMVALAAATAWVTGVRTPRVKAFSAGSYSGVGRVELRLEPLSYAGETLEVMAGMTFGTGISTFGQGLMVRSSFRLPKTGETVVLVLDLDRSSGRKSWSAGEPSMNARLYTQRDHQKGFDAIGVGGGVTLDAAFVREGVVGFRLVGLLELVDGGLDGLVGTEDDLRTELDLVLESTPTAEEVAGPNAVADRCEYGDCWDDRGPSQVGCTTTSEEDDLDIEEPYAAPVGCTGETDDDDSWSDEDDYDSWFGDDDDDDDSSWTDDDVDDNGNDSDDGFDDNGNPT
jgi:hypothetical protein